MNSEPFVRVLGSADWMQTPGNDGACYALSDRILIDTGSAAGLTLIDEGIDPVSLPTICFTHMHADHCIGLLQLLLYWRIKRGSLEGLTIAGPAPSVRMQVYRAFEYVFHDSHDITSEVPGMPRILELHDGDAFETPEYRAQVVDSDHACPGLCYRFTHKETGHAACFSGDTRYRDAFGPFFQDADLLVYEASFGAGPIDPEKNRVCKHSSAQEAARAAREANVKRLLLTHTILPRREGAVEAARSQLSIPVDWAQPLSVFPF